MFFIVARYFQPLCCVIFEDKKVFCSHGSLPFIHDHFQVLQICLRCIFFLLLENLKCGMIVEEDSFFLLPAFQQAQVSTIFAFAQNVDHVIVRATRGNMSCVELLSESPAAPKGKLTTFRYRTNPLPPWDILNVPKTGNLALTPLFQNVPKCPIFWLVVRLPPQIQNVPGH